MIDPANLGLLCIAGENAKKFLQGQLTCNLDEVTSSESRLGAHCNPQGRIISLFRIFLHQDAYYLLMPIDLIPIALKALQKYAVFFKVTLTNVENPAMKTSFLNQHDLCNTPNIYPETSEKFLPHDLDLPKLGAVSFNKGCYTGQEIIARMHYRGKLKNHLYRATIHTDLPITRGADIYLDNRSCGSIVDYHQINSNQYELHVIAQASDVETGAITMDPEKKYSLVFLN